MITISHLTKIFEGKGPRVTALEDVNLEIGKGDIYGIIGMSGAGKSTLLRCLTLLERLWEKALDGPQNYDLNTTDSLAYTSGMYNAPDPNHESQNLDMKGGAAHV